MTPGLLSTVVVPAVHRHGDGLHHREAHDEEVEPVEGVGEKVPRPEADEFHGNLEEEKRGEARVGDDQKKGQVVIHAVVLDGHRRGVQADQEQKKGVEPRVFGDLAAQLLELHPTTPAVERTQVTRAHLFFLVFVESDERPASASLGVVGFVGVASQARLQRLREPRFFAFRLEPARVYPARDAAVGAEHERRDGVGLARGALRFRRD